MNFTFLGGDFRYFWPENISDFAHLPSAWDNMLNTGVGQSGTPSLWITSYLNFTAFFSKLGFSWETLSLIFWILPVILFSFFGTFFLFKHFFPDKILYAVIAGLLFIFNTYFLMILGGGQMGVLLSYSLVPLTLLMFIKTINFPILKNAVISGLIISLQILFDPRIVYITFVAIFLYFLFNLFSLRIKTIVFSIIVPLVISSLLHSYFFLPILVYKTSPVPLGFDSLLGLRFFSFADFSHAFSLLHPNFPENIFGKTYFLQPEFLLLPILAFSSLLFINLKLKAKNLNSNRTILFFAILGLIGVFLAKGSNEPFGQINEFLFSFFPGMSMFRDPTKWYVLITLSYSMLIPYSIFNITQFTKLKIKNQKSKIQSKYQIFNFSYVFFIFTIFYLLFLVRPVLFGQTQIFKFRNVPKDYIVLKDFLNNQPEFFRTLWIPQWQRYGFFSNNHPAIGRGEILKGDVKKQLVKLKELSSEEQLRELGIKYIIVPYDSEKEIFLNDRKYDNKAYEKTVQTLQKITSLKQIDGFEKVRVFEVKNPRDHFWCDCNAQISYRFINPSSYKVSIQNAKKGDILVFSEGFDKNWTASSLAFQGVALEAQKFGAGLNSFVLPSSGDYKLQIYYAPQKFVNLGLAISSVTLVCVFAFLLFGYARKKW